ncbi:RloB domain-containing protein [Methylobacterium sp. DB1607]|nr:RloB domain-containing protein [Methylobacterium sp. DB1607]
MNVRRMRSPRNSLSSHKLDRRAGSARGRTREIAVAYDGERTEHEYFVGWARVIGTSGIVLRPFHVRSGGNALKALEAARRRLLGEGTFDEVWCVCDVDDTSAADMAKAVQFAERHKIKLCASLRSFEVWLALHWGEVSLAEIRTEKDAVALVAKHYPAYTAKSKSIPFSELLPLTGRACQNAKWLEKQGVENPATMMHKLAELLVNILESKRK